MLSIVGVLLLLIFTVPAPSLIIIIKDVVATQEDFVNVVVIILLLVMLMDDRPSFSFSSSFSFVGSSQFLHPFELENLVITVNANNSFLPLIMEVAFQDITVKELIVRHIIIVLNPNLNHLGHLIHHHPHADFITTIIILTFIPP